jgi:hypothetical protein
MLLRMKVFQPLSAAYSRPPSVSAWRVASPAYAPRRTVPAAQPRTGYAGSAAHRSVNAQALSLPLEGGIVKRS